MSKLDGYKTKITAWITALIPVAAMVGWEIDPEMVTNFINEFSEWIAGGFVLLGSFIHFFRNLANKDGMD